MKCKKLSYLYQGFDTDSLEWSGVAGEGRWRVVMVGRADLPVTEEC